MCLGLGAVVYALFLGFFVAMVYARPRWRDQWTYYESLGYPYAAWMHRMHAPLVACPLADVVLVKRPAALRAAALTPRAACAWTALYVAFYAGSTTVNHARPHRALFRIIISSLFFTPVAHPN